MTKMLFDYVEKKLRQAGITAEDYVSSEVRVVNFLRGMRGEVPHVLLRRKLKNVGGLYFSYSSLREYTEHAEIREIVTPLNEFSEGMLSISIPKHHLSQILRSRISLKIGEGEIKLEELIKDNSESFNFIFDVKSSMNRLREFERFTKVGSIKTANRVCDMAVELYLNEYQKEIANPAERGVSKSD